MLFKTMVAWVQLGSSKSGTGSWLFQLAVKSQDPHLTSKHRGSTHPGVKDTVFFEVEKATNH
jgi:hypothetical protein